MQLRHPFPAHALSLVLCIFAITAASLSAASTDPDAGDQPSIGDFSPFEFTGTAGQILDVYLDGCMSIRLLKRTNEGLILLVKGPSCNLTT